ncbi:MAG: insulinase family protein, partial [Armatimonadetes bacterium]|nr:insulinase family protein [Armatimonadota bacterium]
PQNLAWALDLEADRMTGLVINDVDLDAERTIVTSELEMGENNIRRIVYYRLLETAFLWHNYGHPSIGERNDVKRVPLERVRAFYRRHYQPDNAVLVVAGKFDPADALKLTGDKFGPIPRPARKLIPTSTVEPTQDGERSVVVRRAGTTHGVTAAYHIPGGSHPDLPPLDVLGFILGDDASGRLHAALVATGKAATVSTGAFQLRDPGLFMVGAGVLADKPVEPVRDELLQLVEGVGATEITAAEVERAKAELLKGIELSFNDPQRLAISLSEWAGMGDWRLLFYYRDRLKDVAPADVQRVAKAYLVASNRSVCTYYPAADAVRAEIPPNPDVAAMLKGYTGAEAVAQGEAFDPSPSNIQRRTLWTTTPGGLKLALLSKKTRGGQVAVHLALHFGDVDSLRGKAVIGQMTGNLLDRGTAQHTRQQIQEETARLKARLSVSGGATGASATLTATGANLPDVLKLAVELVRQPSFPDNELEQARHEWLAGLEQQGSDPQTLAGNFVDRWLRRYPADDVRYEMTAVEEAAAVRAVTLDQVKAFHADFYGASAAEMAVVGDFDAAALPALVEQLLGGWKSRQPYTRVPQPYQPAEAHTEVIRTPDKPNAVLIAAQPIELRDDDPDFAAAVMAGYLLGGSASSRLHKRIREKEGLSYGVGGGISGDSEDRRGTFRGGAVCATKDLPRVVALYREELERALKDGFAADEVKAGVESILAQRRAGRTEDGRLAGKLAGYLRLGRTLAWDFDFEKQLSRLTPAQVNAALRRHLDPGKLVIAEAGDLPE